MYLQSWHFLVIKFLLFLIFQYCSIVKKMNVLGCNDQFFNVFLNSCVILTSFIMALLNNEVPGRMSLNYYICTGEDPRDYENIQPKVSTVMGENKNNPTLLFLTFVYFSSFLYRQFYLHLLWLSLVPYHWDYCWPNTPLKKLIQMLKEK